eukprot:1148234-Pelagomonas_calceolata.AAC.7
MKYWPQIACSPTSKCACDDRQLGLEGHLGHQPCHEQQQCASLQQTVRNLYVRQAARWPRQMSDIVGKSSVLSCSRLNAIFACITGDCGEDTTTNYSDLTLKKLMPWALKMSRPSHQCANTRNNRAKHAAGAGVHTG